MNNDSTTSLALPPPESDSISLEQMFDDDVVHQYGDFLQDEAAETELDKENQRDNAIQAWVTDIDMFLDELIRLDGRGDSESNADNCRRCSKQQRREYRCRDCFCNELFCRDCILDYHKYNPLHFLEFWNGKYFERITLKSLNLRIQLGHPIGELCPVPQPSSDDSFVIIDTHGVHQVGLDFCGCGRSGSMVQQLLRYQLFPATVQNPSTAATFRVLRHFQILNFETKCSAHDYFQTLQRETDNTGLSARKDRYREFLRMTHEWRHLKMMKRAGRRQHNNSTKDEEGSCAILCPACPQPGINLPSDWENGPEDTRWLYTLFLALDANFRMTRKNVSNEERDPCLTQHRGYFVNSKEYQDHLQTHGGKRQAPSTCVSHDAVNSADTKDSRGLLITGIGTVDCARHDMKCPNSVGDLQKGESTRSPQESTWTPDSHGHVTGHLVSRICDNMRIYKNDSAKQSQT
ncbi:hypothetical protein F5887DRAFT_918968 [Amanita rubescens]|nr:hypothetical protein F5887DRAFT_918968 [Amanita rubescens]